MIAFKGANKNGEDSPEKEINKNLQKLLDIIYNDPEFYPGSHHENVDISYVIQSIYQILFSENNKSVHIILDRKENESQLQKMNGEPHWGCV